MSIDKKIIGFIKLVSKRPGMYVGSNNYNDVVIYLSGYLRALSDYDLVSDNVWNEWVCEKFDIYSTAWGWARIIKHEYVTDEKAIEALPMLFENYYKDLRIYGEKKILSKFEEKFRSKVEPYNFIEKVPAETSTKSILGKK